eukprot:s508_g27.t1
MMVDRLMALLGMPRFDKSRTITETLNYKKITEFLEGKTKQQHIFFFYQRPDILNEHNEPVDAHKDCKLTITTGENERIKSFAVYFLRNVPQDRAIKTDELLFGEVTANPLESLSTTLASVFQPISSRQDITWGECDGEQKDDLWGKGWEWGVDSTGNCQRLCQRRNAMSCPFQVDFLTSFEKFSSELSESISALSGGIVLQKDLPSGIFLDPSSPKYQDGGFPYQRSWVSGVTETLCLPQPGMKLWQLFILGFLTQLGQGHADESIEVFPDPEVEVEVPTEESDGGLQGDCAQCPVRLLEVVSKEDDPDAAATLQLNDAGLKFLESQRSPLFLVAI